EEIKDYLRAYPARAESVRSTLAHFDLLRFAPRVTAATLLMAGAPGSLLDGKALQPLAAALQGQVTVYESQQSLYKDGLYAERWMAAQCGIADVQQILFSTGGIDESWSGAPPRADLGGRRVEPEPALGNRGEERREPRGE